MRSNLVVLTPELLDFPTLADITVAEVHKLLCTRLGDQSDWFDDEIRRVIGVDVYSRPFPKDRGYAVIASDIAHLLIYRFENLDRLPEMLAEFFQIPPPEVVSHNLSSGKDYAEIYRQVRKRIRLPERLLDDVYNRKMARAFYTDDELNAFRQRWLNGDAT